MWGKALRLPISLSVQAMSMSMSMSSSPSSTTIRMMKELYIIRHGQATHNPRAEAARAAGCSFDEFLAWMEKDDSLDSELTDLGKAQASRVHELYGSRIFHNSHNSNNNNDDKDNHDCLIVSSPLSRALATADGVLPLTAYPHIPRMAYEGIREINGRFLNAQRLTKSQLQTKFPPPWNFDNLLTNDDAHWTPAVLESKEDCIERGYQTLVWLFQERPERRIALVAHGGILNYTMTECDHVEVIDGRESNTNNNNNNNNNDSIRSCHARFDNGEIRRYQLYQQTATDGHDSETTKTQPKIVLREIDL